MTSNTYSDFAVIAEKYDYFVFDCDGVLWLGAEQIPDSFPTLNYLLSIGKQCFLVTNGTQRSREEILNGKLKEMYGFDKIEKDRIYSAGYCTTLAVKQIIDESKVENASVYVAGSDGLRNELIAAGVRIINQGVDESSPEMTEEEYGNYKLDPSVVVVVAGVDFDFNYRKLCIATLYVTEGKAKFLATNPDRASGNDQRVIPGGGTVVKAIEAATGTVAPVQGKPSEGMFNLLCKQHNLENAPRSKFLMVGDNLETDIMFAKNNKIDSLLVLSGVTHDNKADKVINQKKYNEEMEAIPTHVQPRLGYSPSKANFKDFK